MRVLLIAEAANPEWVSVPLEGWSLARALARVADVHLVTQVRNRPAILRAGLVEGRDFTAIDSERVAATVSTIADKLRGGKGKGWTTRSAFLVISYYYFERLVWKKFGSRICAGEFDVVHRITPLSPTFPSLLAKRCRRASVPFVLGPLNGGVPWPRGFDGVRRREREWLSYVRGAYKLLPGYRSTRRNSAAILIGSRDTWQQMPARYRDKCVYVPENAVDPARFGNIRTRRAESPLRAIFVGRLVPYKGADMLIEAAAPLMREGKMTLEIVGEGPQLDQLRNLVEREHLNGSVQFPGLVQQDQLQHRLCNADLFTFPSIREFGGAVVLEAMAVGLVPVVIDYGGPAELVTDRTGFRICLGPRSQVISDLRALLSRLCDDPAEVDSRSEAARNRVSESFTWDAKSHQVIDVYDWATGHATKPNFGMPLPDAESPASKPRNLRATERAAETANV